MLYTLPTEHDAVGEKVGAIVGTIVGVVALVAQETIYFLTTCSNESE